MHALIEMGDGTVVSQLGAPDMRTPILRALAFPHRCPQPLSRLDLADLGTLEFRPIVGQWRRSIDMALRVIRAGGDAGAVFNAANEEAVNAFLARRVPFGRIIEIVDSVCSSHTVAPVGGLEDIERADAAARSAARALIEAPA